MYEIGAKIVFRYIDFKPAIGHARANPCAGTVHSLRGD
jgi:hypothetical protein